MKDKCHGQGIIQYGKSNLIFRQFILENLKIIDFNLVLKDLYFPNLCVKVNGNSYEGLWEDGMKNGNGKFYFLDKGQIYEGFWMDGDAKCGTITTIKQV